MLEKTTTKRYTLPCKMQVVAEYKDGASVRDLRLKYDIGGGSTIREWVNQYANGAYRNKVVRIQKTEEYLELKRLKKRITELESALSENILENRMLKATVEAADKALNTDLKKNYART